MSENKDTPKSKSPKIKTITKPGGIPGEIGVADTRERRDAPGGKESR